MEQQENEIRGEFAAKCTIKHTPKVKGAYVLGSRDKTNTIAFHLAFKPIWLHRQMMRIFLGWYWVDEK
jgi:hypothetical protein